MAKSHSTQKRSRFWLFFPFILAAIAIGGWCGWWFLASTKVNQAVDKWIAEQPGQGAEFTYASKSLTGFPFRFDVQFDKPHYRATDGHVWEGDHVQFVMQAWKFQHVIARAPGHNVLTTPLGIRNSFDLDETAAASLSWTAEGPKRIGAQSGEASVILNGAAYEISGLSLNFAPRDESPDDLMLAVQWDKVTLEAAPQAAPYLGTELGPSRLIGEVRNFFPAYTRAGGEIRDVWGELLTIGGDVEVAQLLLDWGPMDLGGQTNLTLEGGRANGAIKVRLEDAAALKEAMIAAGRWGTMEQTLIGTIEPASRDNGFLTLSVIDSNIFAGPVPVGKLPGSGL
ncbi:MAG: DUF2125 domain-containing protein [Hyphomonas sp.]|uniref:DUF2125 domain-containing protein n=1 Tax=Hyphomonas sp. TaxID=87 RepID=UPI003529A704